MSPVENESSPIVPECNDTISSKTFDDTSFLISDIMGVYERQSSYEPNIPLRMLTREYNEEEI